MSETPALRPSESFHSYLLTAAIALSNNFKSAHVTSLNRALQRQEIIMLTIKLKLPARALPSFSSGLTLQLFLRTLLYSVFSDHPERARLCPDLAALRLSASASNALVSVYTWLTFCFSGLRLFFLPHVLRDGFLEAFFHPPPLSSSFTTIYHKSLLGPFLPLMSCCM